MGENAGNLEQNIPRKLDAIVVCGMGPLSLIDSRTIDPDDPNPQNPNLVARNFLNFLNGISAKLLLSHGIADVAFMSGYRSAAKGINPEIIEDSTGLRNLELTISEAELLRYTAQRAKPKKVSREQRSEADGKILLEEEAETTFGNIIQTINKLDEEAGGYWEGQFGVVSSEFHGPRINEMIHAFGLSDQARFISAERVFRMFGYKGRLHPKNTFFSISKTDNKGNSIINRKTWEEFENDVYNGQPAGLQNLRDNPSYVTFELAAIRNDRRLQEMASSLRDYYRAKNVELPDVYDDLPDVYDKRYDYSQLRQYFARISPFKHAYKGTLTGEGYRVLASVYGKETEEFLGNLIGGK